jgi:CheY-like chemotaxis protein
VADKVLIVDDQPVNRLILRAILEREGHEVVEAAGGAEALERVGEIAPSIVLLDIRMPVTDGYAVLRQLKSHAATEPIPVILISAADEGADRARWQEAGAIDYIAKPFDAEDVVARVRAHLHPDEPER